MSDPGGGGDSAGAAPALVDEGDGESVFGGDVGGVDGGPGRGGSAADDEDVGVNLQSILSVTEDAGRRSCGSCGHKTAHCRQSGLGGEVYGPG